RWGDLQNYINAIYVYNSSVSIRNSSIRNSEGTGIYTNSSISVTNSTVQNNQTGIYITGGSITPIISSVTFRGNAKAIDATAATVGGISNLTNTDIYLRTDASTVSCTIPKPGSGSYYVLNNYGFTIKENTTTTIEPGVEIR
ncbi:right-handed parallel beta-helix repeat-containing protein, partial [Spirosoma arboris]|uniref:right-handed parallel beta-helix repeat-containing protein n=1 Tax=Spirosoma arboris TaxID=2682092 RepID=UPI0018DEA3FE